MQDNNLQAPLIPRNEEREISLARSVLGIGGIILGILVVIGTTVDLANGSFTTASVVAGGVVSFTLLSSGLWAVGACPAVINPRRQRNGRELQAGNALGNVVENDAAFRNVALILQAEHGEASRNQAAHDEALRNLVEGNRKPEAPIKNDRATSKTSGQIVDLEANIENPAYVPPTIPNTNLADLQNPNPLPADNASPLPLLRPIAIRPLDADRDSATNEKPATGRSGV